MHLRMDDGQEVGCSQEFRMRSDREGAIGRGDREGSDRYTRKRRMVLMKLVTEIGLAI